MEQEQVIQEEVKSKIFLQVCFNSEMFNFENIEEAIEFVKKNWNKNSYYISIRKVCYGDNVMKHAQIERSVKWKR